LLGEVYMETDETDAARDTLKEVVQRFPGSGEAKRARTLLRKLS
jgi:TolA-binding protein